MAFYRGSGFPGLRPHPCTIITRSRRCTKGDECCFAHSPDNNSMIEAVVKPFRFKIFNELFDSEYSPPLEHLHEIRKITTDEYHAALRKWEDFEYRTGSFSEA